MFQLINDRIAVIGLFENGHLKPLRFRWRHQTYSIAAITTSYKILDGGVTKQVFAAQHQTNIYKLVYTPQSHSWVLEEIFTEG